PTSALGFAARKTASVRPLRDVPDEIAKITMRALASRPSERFESAKAMADALERAAPSAATHAAVAEWLGQTCGARLRATRDAVRLARGGEGPTVVAGDADAATQTVDAATVVDTVVLEPRAAPRPRARKLALVGLAA